MKRYNELRRKIDKMAKEVKGNIAPYMAYLDKIESGYKLSICFWDGKDGSGDKMPRPIIYKFSNEDVAQEFLIEYLKEHKPLNNFVLFTGENEIED